MDRLLIAFVVLAVASLPLLAFEVGTLPGEAPETRTLSPPRLLTVALDRITDSGLSRGAR
mgnify:CR=1 FL=1